MCQLYISWRSWECNPHKLIMEILLNISFYRSWYLTQWIFSALYYKHLSKILQHIFSVQNLKQIKILFTLPIGNIKLDRILISSTIFLEKMLYFIYRWIKPPVTVGLTYEYEVFKYRQQYAKISIKYSHFATFRELWSPMVWYRLLWSGRNF